MADLTKHRCKMQEHSGEEDLYHSGHRGEVREWSEVNRQLHKRGFQAVRALPATDVPVSTGRYVCLDPDSNDTLRHNLLTLLAESDHRQTLVHDLMEANKQLKEDIAGLTDKSDKLQARSKDLKIMLECSRKRVQELERERDMSSAQVADDTQKGSNLRSAIHMRCKQLEETFGEKELEVDKLKKKLKILTEEEKKRVIRQNQIFVEVKKRMARAHSLTDSKLLDIIDMYEKQLYNVKKDLEMAKRGESRLHCQDDYEDEGPLSESGLEPMNNARSVVKSLEHQLQEADRRSKALEDEKELMSLEMSSSVPGEKHTRDPFRSMRKYSTRLEDIEYLPVDICQHYLKELCSELGVEDVEHLLPEIRELSKRLEKAGRYQELCLDMQQLVDSMQDPSRAGCHRHSHNGSKDHGVSEDSVKHSLQIMQHWHQDMIQLPELQESLNRMLAHAVPRARIHFTPSHTVSDMTEIINTLADEETTAVTKEGFEHVSRTTLERIVEHFQTLFDISSISSVLTRMTDIYQRYGEAHNILKTLRHLLGLEDDASSASVVDAVGRLCQAHNSTTSRQLQQLFETDDLGSVIRRLEEHTQFFPAFKEIMCKLFDILGVERMDQVVPTVTALKLLSS
ncbi:centrosomal protein of 70 kDa-like isoform X2 [Littorina saxatilis]|uniref:centrosomal protein of 70 kDa-like isoform X2 n=1 Tax=Littorina saxatilis TaxID=31220 RepID=UPI0038B5FA1C